MTWLGLALVATRGINLAATLSMFGTTVVALVIAPAAMPPARETARRHVRGLLRVSLGVACLSGAVWLVTQSADMASAETLGQGLRAVPVVLFGTRFGHTLTLRLLLLLVSATAFGANGWRPGLALVPAGCALATQAWFGHAAAVEELVLPISVILHVLAAGAWLGGLLPLLLLVGAASMPGAARVAGRFSLLGIAAVLLLAGTAFLQSRELIGGLPGLLGTTYGHLALLKLGLFLVLVGFATVNRLVLVPRLASADDRARRLLRSSIAVETGLGLAAVLAAATLAGQFPASHEQAEWPFRWRLDPTLLADPAVWRAVSPAAVAIGLAVLLGPAGILPRRLRWPALAGAGALALVAAPHFGPLLVPAYPTTFYSSLTDFSSNSIAHGAALFARHCASCHGAQGRGDGPAAQTLPVAAADLTALHLWAHPDGDLYWWITHGYEDSGGRGLLMPGFASAMSDEEPWNLIDYLHAHAAGAEVTATGQWPISVPAPEMDAVCANSEISLSDLRGRVVRLVASNAAQTGPARAEVANVLLTRTRLPPNSSACVARDPDAWVAYAIIAGLAPDALAGTQFLIDPQGWVRRVWISGEGSGWPTPTEFDAALQDVSHHRVRQSMPGGHHH